MKTDIVCRGLSGDNEILSAAEIEKECLSTAWSFEQIKKLPEYAIYIGAYDKDVLCGIASMYVIAGEGQIMNVAVSADFRRKGVARRLMEALSERAINANCEIITLEVAEDNFSAIALYEKCGFVAEGKRNGFYNGKNALIMEKRL